MAAGRIRHLEIPATDLQRVVTFYETVFAWTIDRSMDEYPMWMDSSGDAGGGFTTAAQAGAPAGIVPMIDVDDVRDALTRIESAGGKRVQGPEEIPGEGYFAMFTDTEGNTVGVADGRKHD